MADYSSSSEDDSLSPTGGAQLDLRTKRPKRQRRLPSKLRELQEETNEMVMTNWISKLILPWRFTGS